MVRNNSETAIGGKAYEEPIDWDYWIKLPFWTLIEAVYLIHGREPEDYLPYYRKALLKTLELAKRSLFLHLYKTPPSNLRKAPSDFVQWAKSNELPIPDELKPLCRSDVKLKESADTIEKQATNKKLRPNQQHRLLARKVAKELWAKDSDITKVDMAARDEIQELFKGRVYSEGTVEDWIADLNPNRKPGRRPKKA